MRNIQLKHATDEYIYVQNLIGTIKSTGIFKMYGHTKNKV